MQCRQGYWTTTVAYEEELSCQYTWDKVLTSETWQGELVFIIVNVIKECDSYAIMFYWFVSFG